MTVPSEEVARAVGDSGVVGVRGDEVIEKGIGSRCMCLSITGKVWI